MFEFFRSWLVGSAVYRFDFNEAKRRCRIVLIDDDPTALPLDEVVKDQYGIVQYKIVDAELLQRCESGAYDIVILDYNGIAPVSITPHDGFGIFDRIRRANPEQYIIAISAQTYDISKTAYFSEANDWLKKPTDLATTKNKIDAGIRYLFDKTAVIQRLKVAMAQEGFKQRSTAKVLNRLASANYANVDEINELIKNITKVTELSSNVVGIIKTISRLGTN